VSSLKGKTVVLGVTGSIAAYKSVEVARLLVKAGARVEAVLTHSAERFVGAVTLSGITGKAVHRDMWDPSFPGELHVSLADRADAVLVVPATADVLSRFSQGRADDLLTALVLSARGPVLAAPAMHPRMWGHPATRENVDTLARQGRVTLVGPVHGEVASGDVGLGRMADPSSIVAELERVLAETAHPSPALDLAGVRLLVTAGPTFEPIDPVRFVGNRSSGKMGFSLASAAKRRGAEVTLVAGPVSEPTPDGVTRVDVGTAAELAAAVDRVAGASVDRVDVIVMAAAVADFRVESPSDKKIKKNPGQDELVLRLVKNVDVLAGLGARRGSPSSAVLVGFALETGSDDEILAYARKKLTEKKVDLVVANRADESLGRTTNRIALVGELGATWLPEEDKARLAEAILDEVSKIRRARSA
jgi:phosphopantothenoylcysteine decarboxylase/phosphopantothenate--cysteine ligase